MIEPVPGPQRKATSVGHLVGLDEPLDRRSGRAAPRRGPRPRRCRGSGLVGDLPLDQRGAHVAGADGVAGDALVGGLQRDHLGQALEAVLGADVGRLVRRGAVAVDQETCTIRPQPRRTSRAAGPGRAGTARAASPGGSCANRSGSKLLDRRDVLDAGVVDEDVDAAPPSSRASMDAAVGEVGDEVLAADLGGGFLGAASSRSSSSTAAPVGEPRAATARPMPLAAPVTRARAAGQGRGGSCRRSTLRAARITSEPCALTATMCAADSCVRLTYPAEREHAAAPAARRASGRVPPVRRRAARRPGRAAG